MTKSMFVQEMYSKYKVKTKDKMGLIWYYAVIISNSVFQLFIYVRNSNKKKCSRLDD